MIWIHSVCSNISAQYLGSNHHRIFFCVCLKRQNSLSWIRSLVRSAVVSDIASRIAKLFEKVEKENCIEPD